MFQFACSSPQSRHRSINWNIFLDNLDPTDKEIARELHHFELEFKQLGLNEYEEPMRIRTGDKALVKG